jgi:hypothetical protein
MGASESLEGYRVIDVSENSPASEAGLKSYLDFVISANGLKLVPNNTFQNIICKSKGCRVFLRVFNLLTQAMRDVVVVPREDWGGDGLLGATIRWEDCIVGDVLRIVSVVPGSKAEAAGLVPYKEYIMGTQEETVASIDRLAMLMRKSDSILLFVYSSDTQNVRKVCLETSGDSVGLEVAQGMFHGWPGASNSPTEIPPIQDEPQATQEESQQLVKESQQPVKDDTSLLSDSPKSLEKPAEPISDSLISNPPEAKKSLPPPPAKPSSVPRSKTYKVGSPPGYLASDLTFHPIIFESTFISF